jgi:hypothetical protein
MSRGAGPQGPGIKVQAELPSHPQLQGRRRAMSSRCLDVHPCVGRGRTQLWALVLSTSKHLLDKNRLVSDIQLPCDSAKQVSGF